MRNYQGFIREVQLDHWGQKGAWITCPRAAIPAPGQYLLGRAVEDREALLGTALFASDSNESGFLASPSIPATWEPGTQLELRGPTGRGWRLPEGARRIALIALGETPALLLPVAVQALNRKETTVALFTDASLPWLPAALESQPLQNAAEALTELAWADFLAIDIPLHSLTALRSVLGLRTGERLTCAGEMLIETPMPCGSMADCGACAVPSRGGWKLACKDGPVFDMDEIEW